MAATLEVCVDSMQSVMQVIDGFGRFIQSTASLEEIGVSAVASGIPSVRLELCSALELGGLTPSAGFTSRAVAAAKRASESKGGLKSQLWL